MDAADFRRLLDGYVRGTLTDAEREAVEAWYDAYRELEDGEIFADEAAASRIAREVHGRLAKRWLPARHVHVGIRWLSAAAAVVLAVGVSWWFLRGAASSGGKPTVQEPVPYVEVTTGVRQVKKLVLPDSSTVWVSALSRLRVPERFDSGVRELFLDEGEAFFEVTADPDRPFIVRSRSVSTRVLGTAFNVSNYLRLGRVTVTVQHGKVRVSDSTDRVLAGALVAAQRLTYDAVSATHEIGNTSDMAAAWREGVFPLENATFDEVAAVLSRLHGVELKAARQRVANQRYSLVVRSTHRLDESMRILCSIHENQYRRAGNEVIIY